MGISEVDIKVVGITFKNDDGKKRTEILEEMLALVQENVYPIIEVRREPTNKYDPNAIMVLMNGDQVGYIPKDISSSLSPLVDVGALKLRAKYNEIGKWIPNGKKKPQLYCKITLVVES